MEINSTGIIKSDLTDYLGFWTTKLREVFGNDFVIRKEGVVDNIATAGSLTCLALEDVIMYLATQLNPYTAEGEWQDTLYSIIGLQRRYATFTVATRTINGTPSTVCEAKSIRFKNTATDDIFELNTTITIGENGKAVGSFTAIELGGIELSNDAILEIIEAPEGIDAVYYSNGNVVNVGDDYEDDAEFRTRWLATKSVMPTSRTENGLRTALLPLVNSEKDIKIRHNRTNATVDGLSAHSMNIIIKSGYSDNEIAKTILASITDGVGLEGTGISGVEDITVTLQDSEGTDVDITFTRPQAMNVYFKVEATLNSGYTLETDKIKSAIIDNFKYVLGEKVVANDFYTYLNALESIDYIDTLQVSLDGLTWVNVLSLQYYQYGVVLAENITVSEAE